MRAPFVRAAALGSCALLALACQSTSPSAPEAPAGPAGGLGLSAVTCDGQPATHVLTPGGPGTDGTWFYGTGGKDVIVGTKGDDKIDGRSANDRICLLGGDDEALGGAGKDRLFGGAGADQLQGEGDPDRLDGGTGDDALEGGHGRDKLFGGPGADHLQGGDENDQLAGELGDDFLEGEAGADALDGGADTDECVGGGQAGDTTINCEDDLALLQLVTGYNHTCALTPAGAAYCWGYDGYGQLGDGPGGDSATPVAVTGDHIFASLTAGENHTCGVRTDGAAYCWGRDATGQLGDGTAGEPEANPTPLAVAGGLTFASLAAGYNHTCGVQTDGAAYCWGYDDFGQLGDGTAHPNTATPGAVTGSHTWASLVAGAYNTCGLDLDGAAYCWGVDDLGQLGDGTPSEPLNNPTPVAVIDGHTFASLAGGQQHTCGVSTDGAAYCWGWDGLGQLGDGTVGPNSATPGAVTGDHTWTSLAAGGAHTCGVSTDGAAYCWGYDGAGQLGDGTVGTPDFNPTPGEVTGGHTWARLAAGGNHTCGVSPDGVAYCWGYDLSGQLGDGTPGGTSATPGAVIGLP